jgi:hypothetical protein
MSVNTLRDYGLQNPEPIGVPSWAPTQGEVCPNCGALLCDVVVEAKIKGLKTPTGKCRYLGCPACPYASPSITTAS